jgi:hypothetical protein
LRDVGSQRIGSQCGDCRACSAPTTRARHADPGRVPLGKKVVGACFSREASARGCPREIG